MMLLCVYSITYIALYVRVDMRSNRISRFNIIHEKKIYAIATKNTNTVRGKATVIVGLRRYVIDVPKTILSEIHI